MKINLTFELTEECLEGNESHPDIIKRHLIEFIQNSLEFTRHPIDQEDTFFVDVTDDGEGIYNEYNIKNIL